MLGLLLIYFIGKYFYQLATDFNKNKWVFAVIGVVTYYGGMVLFGFGLGVFLAMSDNVDFIDNNEMLLNIIGIPVGIFSAWILYTVLKNNWKKSSKLEETELLDTEQVNF
jgi:hypothetical protein